MATVQQSIWAVVQTGAYTTDGVVVPFVTPDGQRVPSILFSHPDHGKCIRRRKRLLLLASRIRQLGQGTQTDMVLATPVLGVVPMTIEMPVSKPRHVAPAATANGVPPTPPTPPTPTPPVTEAKKADRKAHEAAKA